MEMNIEVDGLRRRFGSILALDGLSFTVAAGQVTGFVCPNGAGKSTTMRVVLGLDAADEGSATIGGQPYASLRHPLSRRLAAGRGRAAPGPHRPQPPALAGPLPGPGQQARGLGNRPGGPADRGAAQGR